MTVPTQTNKSGPYNCNGSVTEFTGGFPLLAEEQVDVILADSDGAETYLTLTSDYTVTPTGGSYPCATFTITTTSTYASGYTITLIRDVPETQETDYGKRGPYYPDVHETSFDKLTMLIQQHTEILARCVKDVASAASPVTDPTTYLSACKAAKTAAELAQALAEAAQAAAEAAASSLVSYAQQFTATAGQQDFVLTSFTLPANKASIVVTIDGNMQDNDSISLPGSNTVRISDTSLLGGETVEVRSNISTSGVGVTSFNTRVGDVVPATNDYTWAQVDKTTSDIADITTKSHTSLTDIGTNTHAQLDTHKAAVEGSGYEAFAGAGSDTFTFSSLTIPASQYNLIVDVDGVVQPNPTRVDSTQFQLGGTVAVGSTVRAWLFKW